MNLLLLSSGATAAIIIAVLVFVLLGIIFYAIGGKRFETLSIIFYAIAGFSGLFVAKTLLQVVSVKSFGMLVLAAVFYLIGLVFYNLRNVKYMHLISNCVMLMGSIYMFFSLFFMNA